MPRAKKTNSRVRRFQLDLTSAELARIDRIRDLSENPTKSNVIREALVIYEFLLERVSLGEKVFLEKPDNTHSELLTLTIVALQRAVRQGKNSRSKRPSI